MVLQAEPVAETLNTRELAQRAGYSIAWVKRHARSLGGRIVEGNWAFPPEAASIAIERKTTVSEKLTYGPAPDGGARERNAGERDASVVAMLERGATVAEIVIETRTPIEVAMRLRKLWAESKQDDAQLAVHACACGSVSDPRTARCMPCHIRSRVLTDEQITRLAQKD
jgi:hypothetical protein